MRELTGFVTRYLQRPALLREHLRIAGRSFAEGGLGGLATEIRAARHEHRDAAFLAGIARLPEPGRTPLPAQAGRAGTILVVVHDMELGGAQTVARSFGRWLAAQSPRAVRFVALGGGPFRPWFEAVAPTWSVAEDGVAGLRDWAGPEVRALFLNSAASGRFLDLWPEPTPAVAFVHELPRLLARHRAGLARIAERCALVIGGSKAVSEALRHGYGLRPDRVRQAYAFVEPVEPGPDRAAVRAALRAAVRSAEGMAGDLLLVAGCGVLHWRKAPDLFIEVAARVRARLGPRARFVWIGSGPDRAACERRIADNGLGDTVRITGYEADIGRVLAGADLFLLTSEEDPFPLSALQAAQAGLPVICFEAAGGTPELVAHGCGVTVPFRDAGAMAEAVIAYAGDAGRRLADGRRGQDIVERDFVVDRIGPELLGHVEAAIAADPRALGIPA